MVAAHSQHHPHMEAMAQPMEPLHKKHHPETHLLMGPHPPHLTEHPEKQSRLQAGHSDPTPEPRPPRPMAAPGAGRPPLSRRRP